MLAAGTRILLHKLSSILSDQFVSAAGIGAFQQIKYERDEHAMNVAPFICIMVVRRVPAD